MELEQGDGIGKVGEHSSFNQHVMRDPEIAGIRLGDGIALVDGTGSNDRQITGFVVYVNNLEIDNLLAPRHWWKLDESSGHTAADSGYGGADGVVTNSGGLGSPVHTWVQPATSRVDNAFDVSSGWGFADAGNLPISGSFTANIWLDPNNVNRDRDCVEHHRKLNLKWAS